VNKFTVFLSFDKSNELKIKEYLKKIDEYGEIIINESFEKSTILIFFLTKKYILKVINLKKILVKTTIK
jgi:hypothetical protein